MFGMNQLLSTTFLCYDSACQSKGVIPILPDLHHILNTIIPYYSILKNGNNVADNVY